jgi:hypothetical protein
MLPYPLPYYNKLEDSREFVRVIRPIVKCVKNEDVHPNVALKEMEPCPFLYMEPIKDKTKDEETF